LIRRSISTVVLILLIISFVFLLIHLLPGDPATAILGGEDANPTPDALNRVRAELGLDKPLYEQYADWMSGVVQLDLGKSFATKESVASDIGHRLPRTLMITVPAVFIAIVVGIPLGIVAAKLRNTAVDPLISAFALLGFSTPVFVSGLVLVLIFSLKFGWVPSGGFVHPMDDFSGFLKSAALPIATLSLAPMATTMRMTRSSMLEQLGLDYVRTARAKGLSEFATLYRHVLRNSMLPVITVIGLQFGHMFAGSVIVEFIFFWPGISMGLVQAIGSRDYPVIQGVILLIATAFVIINFLTDLSFAMFDPRISYD
jgi:peptide/nickel transport system permease protein